MMKHHESDIIISHLSKIKILFILFLKCSLTLPVIHVHSDVQSSDKLWAHSLVPVFSALAIHKSVTTNL